MFRVPKHLFSVISLQRYKKFLKLPNFAQMQTVCAIFVGNMFHFWIDCSHFCLALTFFPIFFVCSINILIFAPSLVSPATGERAVLYMRKTFSNVCRCRARTSQLPYLQQADDNRNVCVVRFYIPVLYIVRAGVG